MTQNAIVGKLRELLAGRIDSECKVVYLLCECRKLFENIPANQRPFALNMYCHWALHVELGGTDTVMPFLSTVDAYVDGVLIGAEDLRQRERLMRDFIFLDTFKSQFRAFLAGYYLPTDLTDDMDRWSEFVMHYAGVIEDGSLICRARGPLRHVAQVTFLKGRDARGYSQIPFDMMWRIVLLDNRSIDVEVNARPSADGTHSAISARIQLNP